MAVVVVVHPAAIPAATTAFRAVSIDIRVSFMIAFPSVHVYSDGGYSPALEAAEYAYIDAIERAGWEYAQVPYIENGAP